MFIARLLLHGNSKLGQTTHFLPAIVNTLDHLPVFSFACERLFAGGNTTPEENISQTLRNALRATAQSTAVVAYLPDIDVLEFTLAPTAWKMVTFHSSIHYYILAIHI